MAGILVQVNTSNGGMPKLPILIGHVTFAGVDGDWQKNRKVHGGPDRAICIYSEELYAWLNEQGVKVGNGDIGENFTTRGIDLRKLAKGDRLDIKPYGAECSQAVWPYYEASCLKNTVGASRAARSVRVVSTDRAR